MKRVAFIVAALAVVVLGESAASARSAVWNPIAQVAISPHGGATATILIDPLRVSTTLARTRIVIGTCVRATEAVRNGGKTTLSRVAVAVEPLPHLFVSPSGSQSMGSLAPGKTKSVRWTLCTGARGTYAIVGLASGQDAAGWQYVAYSPVQILVVG